MSQHPATLVILLYETVWQSAARDLISTGTLLACVGIGIWVESKALQWVGGLMWCLWLLSRLGDMSVTRLRMTPAEAVRHLIDTFGVQP